MKTGKVCYGCNILKDLICFNKQSIANDGLSTKCKDCVKQKRRCDYIKDINKSRKYSRETTIKNINWLHSIKANIPCIDCGIIYDPYCMDYDHVPGRGIKLANVSRLVLEHKSKDVILAEIAKCDLVCVLCHNKRTYDRLSAKYVDRCYKPHVQRNIDVINNFKNKPCNICNIQYNLFNMQIDHIDGANKIKDVCQLKSCKLSKLLIELDKCQVLCALCHRKKSIKDQKKANNHL
jgi:hypothetical protein